MQSIDLRQFPYPSASLHGRGLVFEREQRWEEAIASYNEALRADPSRHSARLQLAIMLTRLGQFREAEAHLEKFLAEAPGETFSEERAGARRLLNRLKSRGQ